MIAALWAWVRRRFGPKRRALETIPLGEVGGWGVFLTSRSPLTIHVLPTVSAEDTSPVYPHDLTPRCVCHPKEDPEQRGMWIHNELVH